MEINELKQLFSGKRPAEWDDIPDIELYMDQIISYMKRQHIGFDINENITPAMVNNYVKQKVMPKPNGKKYDRDHIAYLTMIVLLKQIVPVGDVGTLLETQLEACDMRSLYEKFGCLLDEELSRTNSMIENGLSENELSDLALKLAISSYADKLACESILDILSGEDDAKKKKK